MWSRYPCESLGPVLVAKQETRNISPSVLVTQLTYMWRKF